MNIGAANGPGPYPLHQRRPPFVIIMKETETMTITTITELPLLVSANEIATALPQGAIFSALRPPVICHKEGDVAIYFTPGISGVENGGKGDLYVCEHLLIWFDPSTQKGVSIDYPTIAIHAISTAGDRLIPRPSVYLQLVDETPQVGIEVSNGDSGSISDDVERMVECRLVPDNEASLSIMFSALSECAALHPGDNENDNDNGAWTLDGELGTEDLEAAQAALAHLEQVFDGIDPLNFPNLSKRAADSDINGQFDDADDNEGDRPLR